MSKANDEPEAALASDLLTGVASIAKYVYGDDDSKTKKKVYYQARRGQLPVFYTGRIINSRKSQLSRRMSAATEEVA